MVRVYVYEMPVKFTYVLLWLCRNTHKEMAKWGLKAKIGVKNKYKIEHDDGRKTESQNRN